MHNGAGVTLINADAAVACVHVVRAQALQHGLEQHAMKLAAVDADLWQRVASMLAARLAVDELAPAVEKSAFQVFDAQGLQLVLQAECGEFTHGVGQQRDANAQFLDLRHALVHVAGDTQLVQGQGEAEASDATTDDGDPDVFGHGLFSSDVLRFDKLRPANGVLLDQGLELLRRT